MPTMTENFPAIDPTLLGITWPEFKTRAIEFHQVVSSMTVVELDSTFQLLMRVFFSIDYEGDEGAKKVAALIYELVILDYNQREKELGMHR